MGAKTDLAVVRGTQVMAIALVVGVASTSTMELIKQKKFDLNGLGQEQRRRWSIQMSGLAKQRAASNPGQLRSCQQLNNN